MIQDFFPGFNTRIMVRCNTKQSLHNGVVKHKNDQAQIMEERAYCATSDLWSTRRVVTTDWPAIWSTMTYPNHLWRSQQWYQNGWSQDVAITNNEPLLCMPTMWIHLGGNKKALLVMVIWRQTHLAVLLHTPLLYPVYLSTFLFSLLCLQVQTFHQQLPTFQRNMEVECSAIMLLTMNNTIQLHVLDQTNTTKCIITTA